MANRKPVARHKDFRIAAFLTKEEALENVRDGQLMFQNFEHTLTGLGGLDALDQSNHFEDGDVILCYARICRNKGYTAPVQRKVNVIRANVEQPAESPDIEESPY